MFNLEAIRQALRTMELPVTVRDREEVSRQWKKLAIRFHPDKNKSPGATEKFKQVHSAWELVQKYLDGGGKLPVPKPPRPKKRPKPGRVQPGPATVPVAGTPAAAPRPHPVHPFHSAPMPEPAPGMYVGGFVVPGYQDCDPLLQSLLNGVGLGGVSPVQIMQDVAASLFGSHPMCPEDGFAFGNGATVGTPWSFGNAPRPPTIHPWQPGARAVPPPPPPGYTRVRVGPPRRRRRAARGPEVVAQSTRAAAEASPGRKPHRTSSPYAGAQTRTAASGRAWFEVTPDEMKRFGRDTGAGARPGQMQGTLLLPGREPMPGCYDVEIRNGVPIVDGVTCTFRTVKR